MKCTPAWVHWLAPCSAQLLVFLGPAHSQRSQVQLLMPATAPVCTKPASGCLSLKMLDKCTP